MDKLVGLLHDVSTKLTDQEYRDIMDALAEVNAFKNFTIDWNEITYENDVTIEFLRHNEGIIDWKALTWELESYDNKLDIVREFKERVDWLEISQSWQLSEDFISEFKDSVDWVEISKHQDLSESFIREFRDRVAWRHISRYQDLSEDFIREFDNRVSWKELSKNIFSESFETEFHKRFELYR